jgi:hypothetical protein
LTPSSIRDPPTTLNQMQASKRKHPSPAGRDETRSSLEVQP